MHDDEHADVLVDRLQRRRIQLTHVERLRELLIDGPRIAHRTCLLIEALRDRQAGKQTDDGFLALAQIVDELRDVVFEKRFLVRLQERNDGFAVRRVGAGEAQKNLVALLTGRHRLQAVTRRAIFVFGERQRVDHFELDLPLRAPGHFFQQFAHARGVGAHLRDVLRALVGIEEIQMNRLVDVAEDVFRALRQGIQTALRQIEPRAAEQHVADEQHGHEKNGENRESAARE